MFRNVVLKKDGKNQSDRSCKKNSEVLYRFKEETNILHTIKRRKVNWIGHILRRNVLLNILLKENLREDGCDGNARKKTYAATG
jgi:hypothetical protein